MTKENRLKLKEFKFRGVSVREAARQSNVSISTVLRWYNRPFGNLSDKIRRKTKLHYHKSLKDVWRESYQQQIHLEKQQN